MTLVDEPAVASLEPEPPEQGEFRAARPLVAVEVGLFTTLVAAAAAAYEPVFRGWGTFAGPVFTSAMASSLLAVALRRWRVPTRFGVLASLLGLFVFLSYTVLVGDLSAGVVPGSETLRALRDGVGNGWQHIVDGNLPVSDATPALVWLSTATWIAGHLTAELVVRTRLVALPAVAPIALFALSLPLVSVRREPPYWLVAAFIAIVLVGVLVRAVPDSRTVRQLGGATTSLTELHSRSVLSARLRLGLPIVAACAALAPIAAGLVTRQEPFDPRALRDEVVLPESVSDPLGQLKAQLAARPAHAAFRVVYANPIDAVDIQRVPVIHLDRYDGVRWTSTAQFRDAGSELRAPAPGASGRAIRQTYTMANNEEPWLPAAATPISIDLPNVAYAAESGDLLAPASASGLTYTVVSQVRTPTGDEFARAAVDSEPGNSRYWQLDNVAPDAIRETAQQAVAGSEGEPTGTTLMRLEQYLVTNHSYDPDAPPGHSYGRIERFLTQDRRGTAEQFAASFAVMARSLGFPARVVVGYRVVEDTDDGLAPLEFVTSAHYHAWVEVRFQQLGWVAFDPTPRPGTTPLPPPEEVVAPSTAAPPPPTGSEREPQQAGPSEGIPEPEAQPASAARRAVFWAGVSVSTIAVVALLAAGTILLAKRRRRRARRHAASVADQVTGAWEEVLDRLSEVRFPVDGSMTPRDVARAGEATYGAAAAEPLTVLVPVVSRAVFARQTPSAGVAEGAWDETTRFEHNLAALLNRRQRLRTRLSLRPLRR